MITTRAAPWWLLPAVSHSPGEEAQEVVEVRGVVQPQQLRLLVLEQRQGVPEDHLTQPRPLS